MKIPFLALAALFAVANGTLATGHAHAAETTLQCQGYEVASEPQITVKGELKLKDGKPANTTLLIEPLGKNGWTYISEWREVAKDGSNFARWFDYESKARNIMVQGLYAGVSPELTESYKLYRAIAEGSPFEGAPKRTLILYGANKKPYAETFCYESEPVLKKKQ